VAPIDGQGDVEFRSLSGLSKDCLTLNVAYSFNHVSARIDPKHLNDSYTVTMNMNPSWIAGLKSGVDISLLINSYENEGTVNGVKFAGITWHSPFPEARVIHNSQISDERYNSLSWDPSFMNFMVYGELNPGTRTLPVPGLHPESWPHTDAYPGPVLGLSASWLEE
jgi:hypothetical protein